MKKNNTIMIRVLIIIVIIIFLYSKSGIFYKTGIHWAHVNSLNQYKINLKTGETCQIKVNALNVRCSYYSSNYRVAYVNSSGKIFALMKGKAVISVNMSNGHKEKCYIIVSK